MTRWLPPVAVLVGTGLLVGRSVADGQPGFVLLALAGLALAWWLSPLNGMLGPKRAAVTADPAAHRVVVYWRPGCVYCLRLRGALGKYRTQATWVSIWADADAAAYVRSVNDGDEIVPTVVIDGQVHTNPDPEIVRAAVGAPAR